MLTLANFFLMLTGMMLKPMCDLAGPLGVAVEAVAEVTVEAAAQVLKGHDVMRLPVAGPRVVAEAGQRVGAEAGAGAILETAMLAAAGAVALLVAVGMRKQPVALGLLGLTQGTQSTKALQDRILTMTMRTTLTTRMTITWKMGRWKRLILIAHPAHKMTNLLHIVLCTMAKLVVR